jgi:hypothetical protein
VVAKVHLLVAFIAWLQGLMGVMNLLQGRLHQIQRVPMLLLAN